VEQLSIDKKMENLFSKYQQLASSIPDKKFRKYFRLKTLSNLIYHLRDVKNEDQEWVYESISKYIDEFHASLNEMSSEKSIQLYFTHLKKTTSYYDRYLGFAYFTPQVIIFLYAVIAFGLYLFTNPFFSISISLLIVLVIISYYYKKHREKKLYGTFY